MPRRADDTITIERVQRATETAAFLVQHHGPEFVPIFERLERELATMQNSTGVIERAMQVAQLARQSGSNPGPPYQT